MTIRESLNAQKHCRLVQIGHGLMRAEAEDEGYSFQRQAANDFNNKSRTAYKGWSSTLRAGREALQNEGNHVIKILPRASGMGRLV
jgi:hypothetical protein